MKSNLFFLSAAALFSAAGAFHRHKSVRGGPIEAVELGGAGDYVILTKSGISTVPDSAITGDIGVSPIASTAITGFSLTMDSTNEFSESDQITGKAYAATYTSPTPGKLTTAVENMVTAYNDAKGRHNTKMITDDKGTEPTDGEIGSQTWYTGVHTLNRGLEINGDITFSGSASEIFIVQIDGDLILDENTDIKLGDEAVAENIFWQVAGTVEVRESAKMKGTILVKTKAVFKTGATLTGRVLAQTACTLKQATITA
jgi:cytoskeletal protein CcmA (bactofilin family)